MSQAQWGNFRESLWPFWQLEETVHNNDPISSQVGRFAQSKEYHERVVLTVLHRFGSCSKADLARFIGLTKNVVGDIVRDLEAQDLVHAAGKRVEGRGQPATLLEVNPEGAFAIGVRIDRDHIECALADLSGEIRDRTVIEDLPPPDEAVAAIAKAVERLRGSIPEESGQRLRGIGVAIPYHLGCWLQELGLGGETYLLWEDFDIGKSLAAATGLRVVVENDGNAAAIGELNHGQGRALSDFVYVFLGPAAGGGLVIDSDFVGGRRRYAGHLGLMPVHPSALASAPITGRRYDPLLSRASIRALTRHLASRGLAVASRADLETSIVACPTAFDEWEADAVDALVGPILSSLQLLDLQTVVIDGDLAPSRVSRLADRLAKALRDACTRPGYRPDVVRGSLGSHAATLGAASIPLHMIFSPIRDALWRSPIPPHLAP